MSVQQSVRLAVSLSAVFSILLMPASRAEEPAFSVYLPLRAGNKYQVVSCREEGGRVHLSPGKTCKLASQIGLKPQSMASHPRLPIIYVCGTSGVSLIPHDPAGRPVSDKVTGISTACDALCLDPSGRFLVTRTGTTLDVYPIADTGLPGERVSMEKLGGILVHEHLVSADRRHIFASTVRRANQCMAQFPFDRTTGMLQASVPLPAVTSQQLSIREICQHPSQPILYANRIDNPGVAVFQPDAAGHLSLIQTTDVINPAYTTTGIAVTDLLVSPDGKFLYQLMASKNRKFDWISRYAIRDDGQVRLEGHTKNYPECSQMQWSPTGRFLLVLAPGRMAQNASAPRFESRLEAWERLPDGQLQIAGGTAVHKLIDGNLVVAGGRQREDQQRP